MQCALGIKVICTAHGDTLEKLKMNKLLYEVLDLNLFERIIFLKSEGKRGEVQKIYDRY